MLILLVASRYSGVGVPELKKTVRTMIYVTLEGIINLHDLVFFVVVVLFFVLFCFWGFFPPHWIGTILIR